MARKKVGIRKRNNSFEVYGKAGLSRFSRRFPLDTPVPVMQIWRDGQLTTLRDATPRAITGSLDEAVAKLLKLESGRRQRDLEDLLSHWLVAFPRTSRLVLTPQQIQTQLDLWRTQGVAASTVNHRRQALRSLYRRLEPDIPNPVTKTKLCKQPEPEPRAVPEDVLTRAFEVMDDSATRARLQIIMHTGMRHSELMRVKPEHVDLDGDCPHVVVRSGKGGRNRVVPLHGLAVQAFRDLARHEAWGVFSAQSARKVWLCSLHKLGMAERVVVLDDQGRQRSVHYNCGLYRPYDLRHRFATRLREHGADLSDVQELLGHKSIATSRRYAPVVQTKLVSCVQALVQPSEHPACEAGSEDPQVVTPQ